MKLPCLLLCAIGLIYWHPDTTGATTIDENVLEECILNATDAVNLAVSHTRNDLYHRKPSTPADLMALFRYPSPAIVEMAKPEEILESVLEQIKYSGNPQDLPTAIKEHIKALSGCTNLTGIPCSHNQYRSFDGTCNNFDNRFQGAAMTPFARLLDPIYEDGLSEPVGWNPDFTYNGYSKPSPRLVSTVVGSTDTTTDHPHLSNFVMLMGQFLDHDMDLTPVSPSSESFKDGTKCGETCKNKSPCFPIPIPENDPRIPSECQEFIRSSGVCGRLASIILGEILPREQMNAITSYIDGSQIYGSSKEQAESLRAFDGKGRLRVNENPEATTGRDLLPYDPDSPMSCLSDNSTNDVPCFVAGDVRANEQIGLTAMHTLFLREHNRIALALSNLNPHWSGDIIYKEARKLVGAELQHIVYDHYLPKVLGSDLRSYAGYSPDVNGAIFNEFATAAFRMGHATVRPIIRRLDENFTPIPEGNLPLHLAFFQPWRIVEQGGIDPILRGFFYKEAKCVKPDELLTFELTEHLFELENTIALDLMALNLQRGRDHAIPGYNEYRAVCGLPKAECFEGLQNEIKDASVRSKLEELYGHVDNIDLFIGGVAENPIPNGIVGPTFTCIMEKQFRNLRDGDRLWYEHECVYTSAQVAEIKKTSLAKIICQNTNIAEIQEDVFLSPDGPLLSCNDFEDFNWNPWVYPSEVPEPPALCPDDC